MFRFDSTISLKALERARYSLYFKQPMTDPQISDWANAPKQYRYGVQLQLRAHPHIEQLPPHSVNNP